MLHSARVCAQWQLPTQWVLLGWGGDSPLKCPGPCESCHLLWSPHHPLDEPGLRSLLSPGCTSNSQRRGLQKRRGLEVLKLPRDHPPTPHPHHPALPTFNCGSTEEASSAPAKAPSVRLNLPSWTAFPRKKMQASCLPASVSWHRCGQSHTGWIRVLGNRGSGRGKEGKAHPCWSELSFRASHPGLQKEKASLQLCRVTRTACTRWLREIPVPRPLVSGRVWRRQPATWSTGGNPTPAPVPTPPQEGVAPSPGL